MKVTAFVGSARKKHTYAATTQFISNLKALGDVDCEIITLSDCQLGVCRGCYTCFAKGEEFCPMKDDRDKLFEKIFNSDGIILASPNYSFHESGQMKIFLDRFGFIFHRPRYFGKVFTSIVVQGIYGGEKITKYFNFFGSGLGFKVVNGSCLQSMEPITEKGQKNIDKLLDLQSRKFYSALIKGEYPSPTLFKLMVFRMARTSMKMLLDENSKDFTYYKEKGWFESDYFYPSQLNPIKKLSGAAFDLLAYLMFRNRLKSNGAGHKIRKTEITKV
jgi:multimeric flavodoxin WrbA